MLKTFKIELIKLKHSGILWITAIFPIFAGFIGRTVASRLVNRGIEDELWSLIFICSIPLYALIVLPLLITTIMIVITRVDHSNNGWKQLLALPVKREHVYCSKLLVGIIILIYSTVILFIALIIGGITMGGGTNIPFKMLLSKHLIMLVAALPIIAVQFYLSFRFSHIAIPLIAGVGLTLPAMMISNSTRFWIYYPWTYPMTATSLESIGSKVIPMYTVCAILFIGVIFIGFLQFRKKDII